MSCQKCQSNRLVSVNAKCSDLCMITMYGHDKDGYVPDDMGIGGGDYVRFKLCLNCGQIQEKFPLPKMEFEAELGLEKEKVDAMTDDEKEILGSTTHD